jgi:group I intron endonuclease
MKRDLTNITGYIYKITAPNGAVYIGQTINLKSRKHDYKACEFKRQSKLWNSCQKYNWNPADTFEVIDECLCGEDKIYLNDREIYWIIYHDSFKNGLNCTEGGKGQLGRIWTDEQKLKQSQLINEMYERGDIPLNPQRGHNLSEEHKEKIINYLKEFHKNNEHWNTGTILSEETKQKIVESTSGEKNHFYGKKHTEESKKKMKEAQLGKKQSEETKSKRSESLKKFYEDKEDFVPGFAGKKHSEETKAKMRESRKKQVITEEHRKKMSEAAKRRHQNKKK